MLKASNSNKFKNSTELAASTKEFEQPSNDNNKFKMKTEKKTLYMSFKVRIFVFVIIFLALFTVSLLCATKIIEKTYAVPVTYTEKINEPNYKVYLKENEFYLEPYLPKNQAYVASLIDYIDVDLQYIFTIDDITNIDFEYKVLADLIIESGNGKELGKREYTIVDSKEKSMKNLNEYLITENLKLDYNYYNQLANSFRSLYGVDTVSYLKVYLSIQKKGSGEGYSIDEKNNYNVIMIPLSERVIESNS